MSQTTRRAPTITLEALPASYGDALLVTCRTGRRSWRMLIDTGPDEVYPQLRQRLLALPKRRNGRRWLDLLVVSHIDHDHIGGARQLLADEELKLDFGDVWFNAPRPAARGVAEGQDLADVLGSGRPGLPWNRAMGGRHLVTPARGGGIQLGAPGAPTLTSGYDDRASPSLHAIGAITTIKLQRQLPIAAVVAHSNLPRWRFNRCRDSSFPTREPTTKPLCIASRMNWSRPATRFGWIAAICPAAG